MTHTRDEVAGDTALDPETLELLSRSLSELFAASADADEVSTALANLGWDEVRQADPRTATTLLFEAQGRATARSRALDDVVLDGLAEVLPSPEARRAVLYPVASHGDPSVSAVLLGPLDGIDEVVVPPASTGETVAIFAAEAIEDSVRPAHGFDSGSGWFAVSDTPDSRHAVATVAAGTVWPLARAAAHRAIAAELVAICSAALDLAVEHVKQRQQFGRSIATFQAVRHRMAEAHVEISAARTAMDAAWAIADDDIGPWAAQLAKMRAGRAQLTVFRHVLQVYGAIGITAESPVQGYAIRAAALDALLGSHASQSEVIGADLLAGAYPLPVVDV